MINSQPAAPLSNSLYRSIGTQLIIYSTGLLCCWFFYQYLTSGEQGIEFLYLPESLSELNDTHQYWLLLTPSLLHFTEWHLLSNLVLWWYFARIVGTYSPWWLLFLLLSSALVSNFGQWILFDRYFGGLSGVVSALVGFLIGNQFIQPNGVFYISKLFSASYLLYLVVVSTGWFGVYSNAAHFGGLFWGLVLAVVFCQRLDISLLDKTRKKS